MTPLRPLRPLRPSLRPPLPAPCYLTSPQSLERTIRPALAALALVTAPLHAQRPATADDFLGLTRCEDGLAVSRVRDDVRDSVIVAQIEAHEAVHREQAAAFPSCEAFVATLTTARRIIDVELPAYCAQWRVAVALGVDTTDLRREFAWRIAAQSGAMENRLEIFRRFQDECPTP